MGNIQKIETQTNKQTKNTRKILGLLGSKTLVHDFLKKSALKLKMRQWRVQCVQKIKIKNYPPWPIFQRLKDGYEKEEKMKMISIDNDGWILEILPGNHSKPQNRLYIVIPVRKCRVCGLLHRTTPANVPQFHFVHYVLSPLL